MLEPPRVNHIKSLAARRRDRDEPRIRKDLEMLRYGLLANLEVLAYLRDGVRLVANEPEDCLAMRLGEGAEDSFTCHSVSVPLRGLLHKSQVVQVAACVL